MRSSVSLRVHARQVGAEHALLVVEADREQVAVLLELVELHLRPLELALEIAFLLGEPRHRRAGPLQLVVEVVLDVRVGDRVRDQRGALGLAVGNGDDGEARILDRLDRDLPGQRAPDRGQVAVRPASRRVVGIVLQPELLRRPLSDAGRLDDSILRLVELLVRPERRPVPELDDVLGAGQDLRGHRIDDQLAGRLVDLRLPVGVDEGDDRRDDDRQDHERPPLADRPPVGAQIELGFARIGKAGDRLRPALRRNSRPTFIP